MTLRIPFNKPSLEGREIEYVLDAMQRGHISGDGVFTQRCHALLRELIGCKAAMLTTSCTDALEMASILLELREGDEVIVPSFTFVSTANAAVLRGARPVFADIRESTLNLDERLLEPLLSPRTRAIFVVHYGGVACEMEPIMKLAAEHGLPVVEDNAHGLFGRYRGQNLGTFGALATQSFHETKNVSCGEGGALLINDARFIERAEIIREKGTNRSQFFRGEADKYSWMDIGSSFLPSDMLAAFLFAQLEARERIQAGRQRLWTRYATGLAGLCSDHGLGLPQVPDDREHPAHLFYLVMKGFAQRQRLIQHLKAKGILAVFHYLPLHLSAMGMRFGGHPGQCPVTERISQRLLRLPFYNSLTDDDQDEVIAAIHDFFAHE